MVKATVPEQEPVDAGIHRAQFGGIREGQGQYGDYWIWAWHVYLEDGSTQEISDLTSTNFGPRSKAHKRTAALMRRALQPNESVDFDAMRGMEAELVLSVDSATGFNNVEEVRPLIEQPAAPQPVSPAPAPQPSAIVPTPAPQQPAPGQQPIAPQQPVQGYVPPDEAPF